MSDFLFFIFVIIIYVLRIFIESKTTNNYGLGYYYGSSFNLDGLAERAEKRLKVDEDLKQYISTHDVQKKLENSFCFLRYWTMSSGTLTFSCRERNIGNKIGRIFTVRGDDNHVATMWALINMEFNSNTTYESLLKLYNSYNNGANYYLYENNKQYYYLTMTEYDADNAYCEMAMIQKEYDSFFIVCRELWRKGNARSFRIEGNKQYLYSIIRELKKSSSENLKYKDLLEKYKADKNCQVIDYKDKDTAILPVKTVDINNATEEEISTLPGINVIMAKKLIKKREEINGFNSTDDVIKFLKLSTSIENKLRKIIVVNSIKQKPIIEKTEERNIDL